MSDVPINKAIYIDNIVAAPGGGYYLSFYRPDGETQYKYITLGIGGDMYHFDLAFMRESGLSSRAAWDIYWYPFTITDPTYDTYRYNGSKWEVLGPIDTTGGSE